MSNHEQLADALRGFASASEHLLEVWNRAISLQVQANHLVDEIRALRAYPEHWGSFDEELACISEFVGASLAFVEGGK